MQGSFEKKFGKYAIKNLSLIMIIMYAVGYLIEKLIPGIMPYLYLNPAMIIHGFQIWRIFTWLLVPPDSFTFLTLLVLYFYYSIGTSLEYAWGNYRYNVYIFSGFIFTVVAAFLMYGFTVIIGTDILWTAPSIYPAAFTTYFVNMSIFLAYATTFPDHQILLFFILPIRVKYLGVIYGAILVYQLIEYIMQGLLFLPFAVVIFASLLNFLIYFLTARKKTRFNSSYIGRTPGYRFQKKKVDTNDSGSGNSGFAQKKNANVVTRHKCAVCGATEITNPDYQFRFCSKCNGNYEYCEKHIFTHKHVE